MACGLTNKVEEAELVDENEASPLRLRVTS